MLRGGVNFGAIRDQSREVEIDCPRLARVLASGPDLSPLQTGTTAPKIDATKLSRTSEGSWGAATGAVAAAFEPKVRTWVINVPLRADLRGERRERRGDAGGGERQALVLGFGITGQFVSETNPVASLRGRSSSTRGSPLPFAQFLVSHPATITGHGARAAQRARHRGALRRDQRQQRHRGVGAPPSGYGPRRSQRRTERGHHATSGKRSATRPRCPIGSRCPTCNPTGAS